MLAIRKRKLLHAELLKATIEGRLLLGAASSRGHSTPARLTRETEVRGPREPIVPVKREVTSSIASVKFIVDEDFDVDVKPPKIELDHRQLRAGIAALEIWPPPSPASSSSGEAAAAAPGPSNWAVRGKVNPGGELGPADMPRRRGRPKGSKTRPRVAYNLDTLPERPAKIEAEGRLAEMKSNSQV